MQSVDTLDGYQFEKLICGLLNKMGFAVEHTSLSGDGGIDIIARTNEIMLKGEYIIQCKRYSGCVGEHYVRDLFGVVSSRKSNKGVLITNSTFSKQAEIFAEGKNIELINGTVLNQLLIKYDLFCANDNKQPSPVETHFTLYEGFDKEKYEYLKKMIALNSTEYSIFHSLFSFLYLYMINDNGNPISSGIVTECIQLSNEIIKKFGKATKAGKNNSDKIRHHYYQLLIYLNIVQGNLEQSYQMLKLNNFDVLPLNVYGGIEFSPTHYHLNGVVISESMDLISVSHLPSIALRNLLVVFMFLNYQHGIEHIISLYNDCFDAYENHSFHFYQSNIEKEVRRRNRMLAQDQIGKIISREDERIFYPVWSAPDCCAKTRVRKCRLSA